MLQLYDLNKVKIKGLRLYKDYKVESVLSSGDKVHSFLYPARLAKDIKEECYIRTKTDEIVVKEISDQGEWKSIKATMNVEDLEGQPWEHFDTTEQTIADCLTLALAGTGWTVQVSNVTKKRTIRMTNCSSWDIIQQAKKTYRVEIEFDTLNKIIKVAEKLGSDKGVYFMDSLNLRNLDIQSNSYDFYTRLIAIGKDNLKVTVENHQYSSKVKTLIWKDERYTDIASLTEDATAKLEEISKPYRSYGADIIDLASLSEKYNILAYTLGDTITLISKEKGIKEKQRIVKITEYPEEPNRNTCEIANTMLTFEDIQKEQQDTSETVNNITSDNGTISEGAIQTAVEHLTINFVDVNSLNAVSARIGTLEATTATITQLNAVNATISNLQVDKANVTDLTASTGRITVLESSVGDIQTLVNGNLTSANIQSLILTSDKVTVANAFIKDAMIDTLSVSKILAGDISTTKFRIKSDSGNMLISDNTIQISDSNRVRVQIGKDALNDYNMYVWDSTGKIMFDATGLKADGIKTKIIRDDMVSDTANINGSKLNIATVVSSINNGATTLNSSKVLLDGTTQTLNVAFNNLSTKVDSTPPNIITDSVITKLTGAIDGMLKINSMSGRTLQNLIKNGNFSNGITEWSGGGYTISVSANVLSSKVGTISTLPYVKNVSISGTAGHKYFVSYDIKPKYANVTKFAIGGVYSSLFTVIANSWNTLKDVVVAADNGNLLLFHATDSNYVLDDIIYYKNVIAIDLTAMFGTGKEPTKEWCDNNISYFNGIRSVNETGENLEVVSCGKNLFDINKIPSFIYTGTTYSISNNSLKVKNASAQSFAYIRYNMKLKANTNYTFSLNHSRILGTSSCFKVMNSDLTISYKNSSTVGYNTGSFTTDGSGVISILLYSCFVVAEISEANFTDIQLQEGIATTYEPYQESQQPITLTEPLRGLPNGVTDTIDFGKGKLVKNIGKVVLNGSESWGGGTTATNDFIRFGTTIINAKGSWNLIGDMSDRFIKNNEMAYNANSEAFAMDRVGVTYISIAKSKLTQWGYVEETVSTYVPSFKAWLQANPTTMYYELAIPIETSIEVVQYMKQFKDGNFIVDGSLINPTIDFTYSTSLASATSMAREVMESNTTEIKVVQGNISTLISNTTVIKDGQTTQLKDAYNSTVATVDGISTIVGNHTTSINGLNQFVTDNGSKITQAYDGITQKVWSADIATVDNKFANYSTTTQMESAITQSATGIKSEVSNTYLSKGDATIQYATKASMELTDSQLRLDFSSSGGYNYYLRKCFTSRLTGTATIYQESVDGFDARCKGTRVFASGSFSSRFGGVIPKNGIYSISFYAKANNGNYPTVQFELCNKFAGTAYITNTWKLFKIENITISNWSDIYNFMDIAVGTTYTWDFTLSHICINEGIYAKPWSPNANEIYSGNTIIDANGVSIFNGGLKAYNNAGVAVISTDTSGNITMKGKLVAGGSNRIEVDNGYINFINGESLTHSLAYNRYVPGMHFGNSISASAQSNGSVYYDTPSRQGLNAFGKIATFMLDLYAPATSAGSQVSFDNIDIRSLAGSGVADFGAVSAIFANCFASEYIAQVSSWKGNVYGTSTLETISLRLRSVQGTSTGMTVRVCIAIFGYR